MFTRLEIENDFIDSNNKVNIKALLNGASSKSIKDVVINIERLKSSINSIPNAPKLIINYKVYENTSKEFCLLKLTVRPSKSYELAINRFRETKNFSKSSKLYEDIIEFLFEVLEKYIKYAKMQINIQSLNTLVEEYTKDIDITFTLGNGITYLNKEAITVGLSVEIVKDLKIIIEEPEFLKDIKYCLSGIVIPYILLKTDTYFTNRLGIYVEGCLVDSFKKLAKREAKEVRVGLGYIQKGKVFSLIEKVAVTKEDIEKYKKTYSNISYTYNTNMTKREKEKGKEYILSFYRLEPIELDGLEMLEV